MLQEQVRLWQKENRGRKMCTSRPNWMSITASPQNYKSKMYQVNLGNMGNILFIDPEKRIVKVEPAVEIGYLNRALVAEGFTLPIVPELDQLTVGNNITLYLKISTIASRTFACLHQVVWWLVPG